MKKLLFIMLLFISFESMGQRFPSIDSLQTYILRFVRNSSVESFTNLRLQNVVYGTTEFLDSAFAYSGVDSIWIVDGGSNADTLRYRKWGVTYSAGLISGGGGSGTVTSFAFTNSTGITGTVLNATTTPTLSLVVNKSLQDVTDVGFFTTNPLHSSTGFTMRNAANTTTIGEWINNSNSRSELYIYNTSTGRQSMLANNILEFKGTGSNYQAIKPFASPSASYVSFTLPNASTDKTIPVSVTINSSTYTANATTGDIDLGTISGGGSNLINGGANIGTGSEVFKDTSSNKLNFRRLNAGTGITVTQNTNDITIAATNVDSSAARVRTGTYAQRIAIASPQNGEVFTQTDRLTGLYVYDQGAWKFNGSPLSYWYFSEFSALSATGPSAGYNAPISLTGAASSDFSVIQRNHSDTWVKALFKTTDVTVQTIGFDQLTVDSVIIWQEVEFEIDALSDGTDSYGFTWGYDNSMGNYLTGDRIVFRYNHAVNSGNWETRTVAAGSGTWTTKDTGVPFAANTRVKLAMEIDGYARTVKFYINNVLVTTHTSPDNVPFPNATTLATAISSSMFNLDRLAGSTTRNFYVNYMFGYYTKKNF